MASEATWDAWDDDGNILVSGTAPAWNIRKTNDHPKGIVVDIDAVNDEANFELDDGSAVNLEIVISEQALQDLGWVKEQ